MMIIQYNTTQHNTPTTPTPTPTLTPLQPQPLHQYITPIIPAPIKIILMIKSDIGFGDGY